MMVAGQEDQQNDMQGEATLWKKWGYYPYHYGHYYPRYYYPYHHGYYW